MALLRRLISIEESSWNKIFELCSHLEIASASAFIRQAVIEKLSRDQRLMHNKPAAQKEKSVVKKKDRR